MTYKLQFHSLDYGPGPDLTYYGQSMPLIPRIGERVMANMFNKAGGMFVQDITYEYKEDVIEVLVFMRMER